MPLTDTTIRQTKPADKPKKLFDSGGLFLQVSPKGGKWWRFRYSYDSKEKLLSLGTYPDTGLKAAREKRDDMRKLLAAGIDPGENRKAVKAAKAKAAINSLEVIAREWLLKQEKCWTSGYYAKVAAYFENDIFPYLGKRPLSRYIRTRVSNGIAASRDAWSIGNSPPYPADKRPTMALCHCYRPSNT